MVNLALFVTWTENLFCLATDCQRFVEKLSGYAWTTPLIPINPVNRHFNPVLQQLSSLDRIRIFFEFKFAYLNLYLIMW